MENPFIIGKAAEGEYFINRSEDRKRLEAVPSVRILSMISVSPSNGTNTIIPKTKYSHCHKE